MMAIIGLNFHVNNINQFQNLKNLEMEVFTIPSINSKSVTQFSRFLKSINN